MKKIGIFTLYGNTNFGNKLQNYAIQYTLNNMGYSVETIRNYNSSYKHFKYIFNRIKYFLKIILKKIYRNDNFIMFNKKYMTNSKKVYFSNEKSMLLIDNYDFFFMGSDQVWNPYFGLNNNFRFLDFIDNKASFSASFGVDEIPTEMINIYREGINRIKYISVREEQAKNY